MRRFTAASLILSCLLIAACASQPTSRASSRTGQTAKDLISTVFVTSNGWHSGIVLSRDVFELFPIPEIADFPNAQFVEFGWGDADYYPAKSPGVLAALRAGFLPTETVMHVASLHAEPVKVYKNVESIALSLDRKKMEMLIGFIRSSFDRKGRARAASSGSGLYRNSKFYPALGRFHLGNTCNTWTARALAAAGLDVDTAEATRAEELMSQIRPRAD